MLAKSYGCAVFGIDASIITIEANVCAGTKRFMVGLPDNAVKESWSRIESALKYSGFTMPRTRIILNLAPADIKKEGSAYDLPIALSLMKASKQLDTKLLEDYVIMGELALDGQLRPIKGALLIAILARKKGYKGLILPKENSMEAAIVNDLQVIGVSNISDAVAFLMAEKEIRPFHINTRELFYDQAEDFRLDFKDVQGQGNIKRALEIAAAGSHNAIMIGSPGAGKTMLAKRLPSILPPLNLHEALETTKIHSVAGKLGTNTSLISRRPFRSPHHTISDIALVGGGAFPQPGEISLAHNGVLFLDELPEFRRTVLEVMRQPLEERKITISRAKFTIDYPSNFMLIASMNPCPCGFYNHPEKDCVCTPDQVHRYLNKISGPLLDRIDLHVEVTPVSFEEITSIKSNETSQEIRKRVIVAREIQTERFNRDPSIYSNSMMPPQMVRETCHINRAGLNLLRTAMEKLDLSARAYDRILKVSRTIADLSECKDIRIEHLAEAIQYRSLDREGWIA